MAHSVISACLQLTITLLIAMAMCRPCAEGGKMRKTKMVMYLQDRGNGPNATAVVVAGINGTQSSEQSFGTVAAIDHAVTAGIERNSSEIGRARGMYVNAARDGNSLHLLFSIVMTAGQYNGSTIEIQGNNWFLLQQRELSVVSGTGAFRFASGYVLMELAFADLANLNTVLKLNVTVRYPAM